MGNLPKKSGTPDWTFASASPEETEALAESLARRLRGGEVLFLKGPLGVGKTLFAAALARGLGVEDPVTSPTYVLHCSYDARDGLTLEHFDFYRLEDAGGADQLGVEEFVGPQSIVIVEWPERCPGAFDAITMQICITVSGENRRTIEGTLGALPFDLQNWPNMPGSRSKKS